MVEFISSNNVIARKPHVCFSCLRKFPAGTTMNHWVGKIEGDFNSVYACMTCVEIMNMPQDEEYFPEGFVREMQQEGETPEMVLERFKLTA